MAGIGLASAGRRAFSSDFHLGLADGFAATPGVPPEAETGAYLPNAHEEAHEGKVQAKNQSQHLQAGAPGDATDQCQETSPE